MQSYKGGMWVGGMWKGIGGLKFNVTLERNRRGVCGMEKGGKLEAAR